MRIMLLAGPSGCGKTATFHKLYALFAQGAASPPPKQMGQGNDFECVLSR